MAWLTLIIGYVLGSIPTAYIAGRVLRRADIRRLGDANMGAANAYRELGARVGIAVGIIDAAKGALSIIIARALGADQTAALLAGMAAVVGHNWTLFARFRGGRGESTTIGVLYAVVTVPILILTLPAIAVLVITRRVIPASAVLFISLPVVEWLLGVPGTLIVYSIALPCIVGLTHFLRTTRRPATPRLR